MNIKKISNRFDQVSEDYDNQRKYFIPCFNDYYETSISFLSECKNDFKFILDLGAGTGLLTKYLINYFPQASFTLVDISESMLEVAKSHFEKNNNINFIISDYSKKLPDKKFDLIASALSIHHLENDKKKNLYKMIFQNLEKGGYFINLDQFNTDSTFLNDKYNNWWYKFIENSKINDSQKQCWLKRRELDKENTTDETKTMLKTVGFSEVECIYNFMKFGVIFAIK
jgi:tRNA (cmo5U34)-methyltransferase